MALIATRILQTEVMPATGGTKALTFAQQFSHDAIEYGSSENAIFLACLERLTKQGDKAGVSSLGKGQWNVVRGMKDICRKVSEAHAQEAENGAPEMRALYKHSADAYAQVAEAIDELCNARGIRRNGSAKSGRGG